MHGTTESGGGEDGVSEQFAVPEAGDKDAPGEDFDAIHPALQRFVADEDAVAEGGFFRDGAESFEVACGGVAGGLGLDGDFAGNHEIDFEPRAGAPVGDFGVGAGGVGEGGEFVQDPGLEGVAVLRGAGGEGSPALEAARHTGVEEVELGGLDGLAGAALPPDGDFAGEQGVLQDAEILLDGGTGDAGVGGDGLVVDLFAGGKGRHFEKAAEGGEVAGTTALPRQPATAM